MWTGQGENGGNNSALNFSWGGGGGGVLSLGTRNGGAIQLRIEFLLAIDP